MVHGQARLGHRAGDMAGELRELGGFGCRAQRPEIWLAEVSV
jgi:hypothetical protein